jgi:hypothetical protein
LPSRRGWKYRRLLLVAFALNLPNCERWPNQPQKAATPRRTTKRTSKLRQSNAAPVGSRERGRSPITTIQSSWRRHFDFHAESDGAHDSPYSVIARLPTDNWLTPRPRLIGLHAASAADFVFTPCPRLILSSRHVRG